MSGIPAWAVPGAKVVCVKDGVTLRNQGLRNPEVGSIYTVDRAFIMSQASHPAMVRDEPCVVLVECPNVANSITMFRPATKPRRSADQHQRVPA